MYIVFLTPGQGLAGPLYVVVAWARVGISSGLRGSGVSRIQ